MDHEKEEIMLVKGKLYKQTDPVTGQEKTLGTYLGLIIHFSEYGHRFSEKDHSD